MAKRKKPGKRPDLQSGAVEKLNTNLFAETNRGLLLDIFIFLANLYLLRLLTTLFIDLFRQVSAENPLPEFLLSLTFVGMWILPAAGAVLKRWHFHQRLKAQGKTYDSEESVLAGCLFNPLFYFCLNLVIMSAVLTGLGRVLFGEALLKNGALFIPLIFLGLGLTIIQTYLIYLYFSPPKEPPKSQLLRDPRSEIVGDICIFVNMILFQMVWNSLTFADLGPVSGIAEFAGRLFLLSFLALLIYFPPRMFYLAEDINRPRTWLTMLLANSPVILRVLVGTGSNGMMNWE